MVKAFKVGDIVEFWPDRGGRFQYNAKDGALAVVKGFDREYVSVVWQRDALCGVQANGNYYAVDFRLHVPEKISEYQKGFDACQKAFEEAFGTTGISTETLKAVLSVRKKRTGTA